MTPLDEALALDLALRETLNTFRFHKIQKPNESEVRFRLDTVEGVLIMALNDTKELVRQWSKYQKETAE